MSISLTAGESLARGVTGRHHLAGVHEVDDSNIGFAGVFAVQAAGVLLQRAFPRNRHGQHQGVQWRVIKTFANQLAGGQQDARRLRRQQIELCH
jgi:hypothetical protein